MQSGTLIHKYLYTHVIRSKVKANKSKTKENITEVNNIDINQSINQSVNLGKREDRIISTDSDSSKECKHTSARVDAK